MRYLTHYEEYPIYEAAEGGYYYEGNQIVTTERLSKRQAKKELARLWEEAKAENLERYGMEIPNDRDEYGNRIYPWHLSSDGNMIWKSSHYIGEGESYVIERNKGSQAHGYEPYC